MAFDSAEEGLKALENNRFDLIFLDFHLGGMNGLDMLREARKKKLDYGPVIMLTTEFEDAGSEIKDLNVISWIIKPLNEARILTIVSQVLKLKGA